MTEIKTNRKMKQKIVKIFTTFGEVDGISRVVSLNEIQKNDYNLNVTLYAYPEDEFENIDIQRELQELSNLDESLRETENNDFEERYKLGLFCEDNKLYDLAKKEFEFVEKYKKILRPYLIQLDGYQEDGDLLNEQQVLSFKKINWDEKRIKRFYLDRKCSEHRIDEILKKVFG
jgi:hypothetical protein